MQTSFLSDHREKTSLSRVSQGEKKFEKIKKKSYTFSKQKTPKPIKPLSK